MHKNNNHTATNEDVPGAEPKAPGAGAGADPKRPPDGAGAGDVPNAPKAGAGAGVDEPNSEPVAGAMHGRDIIVRMNNGMQQ